MSQFNEPFQVDFPSYVREAFYYAAGAYKQLGKTDVFCPLAIAEKERAMFHNEGSATIIFTLKDEWTIRVGIRSIVNGTNPLLWIAYFVEIINSPSGHPESASIHLSWDQANSRLLLAKT